MKKMGSEKINLSIRFFAILREIVGSSRLSIHINHGNSIVDVIGDLILTYDGLKKHLYTNNTINTQFVYVLNGEGTSSFDTILKDNDELAILPPSGGG